MKAGARAGTRHHIVTVLCIWQFDHGNRRGGQLADCSLPARHKQEWLPKEPFFIRLYNRIFPDVISQAQGVAHIEVLVRNWAQVRNEAQGHN